MGKMKAIYTALSMAKDKDWIRQVFDNAVKFVNDRWEDRRENYVRLPIFGSEENAEALMWALMEYYATDERIEQIRYQYAGQNQTLLYGVEVLLNFVPEKKEKSVGNPRKKPSLKIAPKKRKIRLLK